MNGEVLRMKTLHGTMVLVSVLLIAMVLQPARTVLAAGLVTTDLNSQGTTAVSLAQSLVRSNSGVTISNASYTGANNAAGTFSGGTGIIGFDSGVVLSTGSVYNVICPHTSDGI